jgi:hypothetical protein
VNYLKFGCIEKGLISIHLADINSFTAVQCGGSDAWYQSSTSMNSSARLPTKQVQWLEPKQVAAQVFPIYLKTGNLEPYSFFSIFPVLQTSNILLHSILF